MHRLYLRRQTATLLAHDANLAFIGQLQYLLKKKLEAKCRDQVTPSPPYRPTPCSRPHLTLFWDSCGSYPVGVHSCSLTPWSRRWRVKGRS